MRPLFTWAFISYLYIIHCHGMKLTGGKTANGNLILKCSRQGFSFVSLSSVYWKRNGTKVFKTRFWWTKYYDSGSVYEKELLDVIRRWSFHRIELTASSLNYSWSCSEDENGGYSQALMVSPGEEASTDVPSVDLLAGNLTLHYSPQYPVENEKITLSCSSDLELPDWSVEWIRNRIPVVRTGINSTILGQQNFTTLENRTEALEDVVASTSTHQHNITFSAKSSILEYSTWCCQSERLSDICNNITVTLASQSTTMFVEEASTDVPSVDLLAGNLTLHYSPQYPVENEKITLSCSSDLELPDWSVEWIRNRIPVVRTGINSTILGQQNFTTLENRTEALEDVIASTSTHQHNITFSAKSSILEYSTWFCQSERLSDISNNITVTLASQSTTMFVTVTEDPESSTSMSNRKERTVTNGISTPYIAAVVAGIVGVAVIVTVVVVVKRKSKMFHTDINNADSTGSSLNNNRKRSLVMEDNMLYISGTEAVELTHLTPSDMDKEIPVMEDNMLYMSGTEAVELTHQTPSGMDKEIPVMVDNSLYEC